MRILFLITCASLSCLRLMAQAPDPLAATLPNGKVIHFQTAEQKARFEAARQRQLQPAAAVVAATPSPGTVSSPAANAPGKIPFITLEAKNSGGGSEYNYDWISGYGSYDVTIKQRANVAISLENRGRAPAEVVVRCYFFARSATSDGRGILSLTEKQVTLQPNEHFPLSLGADTTNRDYNLVLAQERYRKGLKYEGWVVQALVPQTEQVIKQVGSHSYLEDFAANKTEFAKALATYQQDLTRSQSTGGTMVKQ